MHRGEHYSSGNRQFIRLARDVCCHPVLPRTSLTAETSAQLSARRNSLFPLTAYASCIRPTPLTPARTAIDPLMSPRAPQPTLDAVYLLTPTTQNVKRVLADFQEGRRTYRHVHLYFIDGTSGRCGVRHVSLM